MAVDPAQLAQWQAAYENAGAIQLQSIQNQYKLGTAQIANNYKMAMLQNGISQQTVENTREYQRGQLAQAAAEMQNIGIPQVAIQKFVAESNAEIAKGELAVKQGLAQLEQQKFGLSQQQFAEAQNEFVQNFGLQEAGVTGTYNGSPTLAAQGQEFNQGVAAGGLTGTYNGAPTLAAQGQAFNQGIAAGGLTGYYGGQQTLAGRQQQLDEAERQRQYGLAVGQFGAQLASTPDRYFQARRFAALDAPRLLGQDTSGVSVAGGPTPQIQSMGAYLTGADPSQGYVPPPTFGSYGGGSYGAPPTQYAQNYAGGAPTLAPTGSATGRAPDPYATYLNQQIAQGQISQEQAQQAWQQYGASTGQTNYAGGTPVGVDQGMARGWSDPNTTPRPGGWGTSATPSTPYGGPSGSSGVTGRSSDAYGADVTSGGRVSQAEGGPNPSQQIGAIARASPPSPYDGLSDQDSATLRLMQSIYAKGGNQIAGGELDRLKASGNYGFLASAGNLLGYDPNQLSYDYERYKPSQGSSALAG